jgi:hypothetical protein
MAEEAAEHPETPVASRRNSSEASSRGRGSTGPGPDACGGSAAGEPAGQGARRSGGTGEPGSRAEAGGADDATERRDRALQLPVLPDVSPDSPDICSREAAESGGGDSPTSSQRLARPERFASFHSRQTSPDGRRSSRRSEWVHHLQSSATEHELDVVEEDMRFSVSKSAKRFPHSPINPLADLVLPKPQGVNQWCCGKKVKINTRRAIKVNMKINVLEISSVDQVREQFTAIFTMQMFYVDPMLKDFRTEVYYYQGGEVKVEKNCQVVGAWKYSAGGKTQILLESGQEIELAPTLIQYIRQPDWDSSEKLFKPVFTFGNAIAKAEVIEHIRMLEYCSSVGGHVFEKYKFQGTFTERLELGDMPFDRQMLRIRIYGEEPIWRQQLAPFKDDSAGWLTSDNATPTEWEVDREVDVESCRVPAVRLLAWKLGDDSFRSVLEVVIHLKRVPTFYLWNVVVINFFITLMTLTSYASVPDDFNGRSEIQFLLLLTTVGYKLVTSSWLPVKSYLTLMDWYILANFGLQALVIVQTFCCLRLACTLVPDLDEDWQDGEYTGVYKFRTAPDRECWPQLDNFERVFATVVYGPWIISHIMLLFAYQYGYTRCFVSSWTRVYSDNGMIGPIIEDYDQFPYGDTE